MVDFPAKLTAQGMDQSVFSTAGGTRENQHGMTRRLRVAEHAKEAARLGLVRLKAVQEVREAARTKPLVPLGIIRRGNGISRMGRGQRHRRGNGRVILHEIRDLGGLGRSGGGRQTMRGGG